MVKKEPKLQIICEVSDGLVAIHKANGLEPDQILLDGRAPLHGYIGEEVSAILAKLTVRPVYLYWPNRV